MQPLILVIALTLMAALSVVFWRAARAAQGGEPGPNVNAKRKGLIWALTLFGVLISAGSLREWPHAVASEDDALAVHISGGQWWWEIDTVEIPINTPVNFTVTTEDVTHGMGIYNSDMRLLIQAQAIPGYDSVITYAFETPGTYQVLCMEYCGVAHHDMINEFEVVAEASQ